jgi:transposase-like protein
MAKQELSIPALMNKIPTEADAYLLLEGLRWADGVVCPHCGSVAAHYFLKPRDGSSTRATRTGSRSQRRVWKCRDCRKQFSVLTGTIFHGTKISLRTWLFVIFEMCASKNGVAAREIERKYDLTPKSAWYMTHRIREAMKREPLAGLLRGTVVADETWMGGKPKNMHRSKRPTWGHSHAENKTAVLSLVDTTNGEVRSEVVREVTGATVAQVMARQVDLPGSTLHTDEAKHYLKLGKQFRAHESVNHSDGEYVRGTVSTNAAEGYFSQLKRSIDGTHHALSSVHLPRYLAEFDYRYSTRDLTDSQRMTQVIGRVAGRRLSYKPLTDG